MSESIPSKHDLFIPEAEILRGRLDRFLAMYHPSAANLHCSALDTVTDETWVELSELTREAIEFADRHAARYRDAGMYSDRMLWYRLLLAVMGASLRDHNAAPEPAAQVLTHLIRLEQHTAGEGPGDFLKRLSEAIAAILSRDTDGQLKRMLTLHLESDEPKGALFSWWNPLANP